MQGTEHDIALFLALGCAADAGLFLHTFGVLGRLGPQKPTNLRSKNRPFWGSKTDFLRLQEGSKTGSLLEPDFYSFLDPLGRLPNPSWGPLGPPLGAPGRFLAAPGRSWSGLGTSWRAPGGVLGASKGVLANFIENCHPKHTKIAPKSMKNQATFLFKNHPILRRFSPHILHWFCKEFKLTIVLRQTSRTSKNQ